MNSNPGYAKVVASVDESPLLQNSKTRRRAAIISPVVSAALIAVIICVAVGIVWTSKSNKLEENADRFRSPVPTIESVCKRTRYPEVCVSSLSSHPESSKLDLKNLGHIAVAVAMNEVTKVFDLASDLAQRLKVRDPSHELMAVQDCVELIDDTVDKLGVSLSDLMNSDFFSSGKQKAGDVQTWLSASLTNQETCSDGLIEKSSDANANALFPLLTGLQNATTLVSNSLAIVKTISGHFSAGNLNLKSEDPLVSADPGNEFYSNYGSVKDGFPSWLSAGDRRLLEASPNDVQPDVIVAQDGTGNYKTITEAVNAAPENSNKRYVIKVKNGTYEEYVDVSKKKTNLMFVGDGMDETVVTGSKNVVDGSTTFRSATFAAVGKGFIAQDMAFVNTAGAAKHQAVALRVGSDQSVVYRCKIDGFQDTLYAHSLRQFYRDCKISGTVDFIFGNAAVVFQRCTVLARKPMDKQKNTITAQGRTDPNQNTGISVHSCNITADTDLIAVKSSIPTYLGRPWKEYSRTVIMQSSIDDVVDPAGWLEWAADFALSTLYYGEYMNSGAGAGTGSRVKWPGYRVITSSAEAVKFTVREFIQGNSWLDSTGVAYVDGLIE